MPLVEHSKLPVFGQLRAQGHEVLSLDRAEHQDIRELHIGFLNMMPDAALQATERQFIRLVGGCNRIAQFFVYPFSLPGLPRSQSSLEYIERYYSDFETLRDEGLDALIITGANVTNPALNEEPFWEPLIEVVNWAQNNVASMLCSCLATHALLKHLHDIDRQPLAGKRWGVYSHRVSAPGHPLLREINTRFDVPHSRFNDISREQFEAAGLPVLAESRDGGVHLAASPDQFRVIYMQGHPEYDVASLLKEYRRELQRFASGDRETSPPFPEHYFSAEVQEFVALEDTLEKDIVDLLDNTWGDTAKAIVNNWLGLVYGVTNVDRKQQFMPGIDANDPLGLMEK